jgi:hypothetical protein
VVSEKSVIKNKTEALADTPASTAERPATASVFMVSASPQSHASSPSTSPIDPLY